MREGRKKEGEREGRREGTKLAKRRREKAVKSMAINVPAKESSHLLSSILIYTPTADITSRP